MTDTQTVRELPPLQYLQDRAAPDVQGPRNRDLEDAFEACRIVVDLHNQDKAVLREWREDRAPSTGDQRP